MVHSPEVMASEVTIRSPQQQSAGADNTVLGGNAQQAARKKAKSKTKPKPPPGTILCAFHFEVSPFPVHRIDMLCRRS